MAYVVLLVLLLGVVWLVSGPLREAARTGGHAAADPGLKSIERLDLEAARDAKFREIRDAELDHQTGKLSDEDFDAIDSTLRSEAIELLHQLDALDEEEAAERYAAAAGDE